MASKERYNLNYTDNDGVRRHKDFYGKTQREAKDKAIRFLQNYNDEKPPITFSEWAAQWFDLYPAQSKLTDATLQGYQLAITHLNAYFGRFAVADIKPVKIRAFFTGFKKPDGTPYSPSMVRKVRNTLNAIMQAACDNEIITHNPVTSFRIRADKDAGKKHALTIEQARLLSEYAKRHPDGLGAYILLHTGLRVSEMMGLMPEDFDFNQGTLTLHRTITDAGGCPQINTKGKTATALRTVLLDPDAAAYLKSYLNDLSYLNPAFLFKPKSNRSHRDYMGARAWSRSVWARFIKDFLSENSGFFQISPGELRHTWFTLMREVNADLRVVDLQGGHALKGLTDGNYSHYTVKWLKENTKFPDYKSNEK